MQTNDDILQRFEQFVKELSEAPVSITGINQVTKALERNKARLVLIAEDTSPPEIVMHLPTLCKDRGVLSIVVRTKEDIGRYLQIENGRKASCGAIVKLSKSSDNESLEQLIKELEI